MERRRQVLVAADEAGAFGGQQERGTSLVRLRHPRSGARCWFLVGGCGKRVLEVQRVEARKPGSWLLAQSVQSDGTMMLCTPIDPLFLLLPKLEQKKAEAPTLQELCHEDKTLLEILEALAESALLKICDTETRDEQVALRLNPDKVESWLRQKVERVCSALQKRATCDNTKQHVVSGFNFGGSQTTVAKNASSTDMESAQQTTLAIALVSEYLPTEWSSRLSSLFEQELMVLESTLIQVAHVPATVVSTEFQTPLTSQPERANMITKAPKPPQLSLAQKQLAKVDKKGMKSLHSFFAKAP